ncbi:MAG TPA: hypothetical protein VLJ40_16135 [Arthrobacter sp.]|nr:hypothetical protein [Arthrobacter sp.]
MTSFAVITLGGFFHAAFRLEDPPTAWLGSIDLGAAARHAASEA